MREASDSYRLTLRAQVRPLVAARFPRHRGLDISMRFGAHQAIGMAIATVKMA